MSYSVISMKDIYFYISGTGALAGTQVLENIAEFRNSSIFQKDRVILSHPLDYFIFIFVIFYILFTHFSC